MTFVDHSKLKGQHAFLSASSYHWLNYDEKRLIEVYSQHQAKEKGIELHDFACKCIQLNQKLPRNHKTLNMYVNDAIGFKMTPEQILYYSDNCFGTADAISFRSNILRIHDLKTGVTPAKMEQLMVYAALFSLEYAVKPNTFTAELRIYQNNEVQVYCPSSDEIMEVITKIITFDKIIQQMKEGGNDA